MTLIQFNLNFPSFVTCTFFHPRTTSVDKLYDLVLCVVVISSEKIFVYFSDVVIPWQTTQGHWDCQSVISISIQMSTFYSLSSSSPRHQTIQSANTDTDRRFYTTRNTFVFAGYQTISPQTKLLPRIELSVQYCFKTSQAYHINEKSFMNGHFLFTVTLLSYLKENDWWF